jgi:hypothetical protein
MPSINVLVGIVGVKRGMKNKIRRYIMICQWVGGKLKGDFIS